MTNIIIKKKPRRRRRIKRSQKSGQQKFYFTADTQAAIEEYQLSTDTADRHVIYTTRIFPAFDQLVENLICIYRFSGLHDTPAELKNDCITFLFETLPKFNAEQARENATKAFSYFNVVAKNWLIVKNRKRQQTLHRSVSLDSTDDLGRDGYTTVVTKQGLRSEQNFVASPDDMAIDAERINGIESMLKNIRAKLSNEVEIRCIDAIIHVFEHAADIELYKKRAVFTYIREISGLSPKQLTIAIAVIRRHYGDFKFDI